MEVLNEIRSDIKEMLQAQARIEERMKHHAEEMHEHKESTNNEFNSMNNKIQPVLRSYNGIKYLLGLIIFTMPIAAFIIKYL